MPLDIWMVASEVAPLAQTGGLADVLRALPGALQRRGHRVRVFLPAYGRIDRGTFAYDEGEDHLAVPLGIGRVPARFLSRTDTEGVRTTLVQCEELFGRDGIYGPPGGDYPDNARRFTFLSRAVVALAARTARPPDVMHGHDWHAGLLPLFARLQESWRTRRPATVLTIHNMGYQGRFGASEMDWITPAGHLRDLLFRFDALEYESGISFLKGALQFADRLTAVSPRYAWEITTMEGGFGLHDAAWRRRSDLAGILNGADYSHWDPRHDPHIARPYEAATLDRKEESRHALLRAFGLGPPAAAGERPVLGVVSRLVDQKGIDVLLEAAPSLLRSGACLIVLGSGERRMIEGLERLRRENPARVGLYIGFNEPLSHLIVAGSDMILVPSRYEPCGLVQMHAMRYGTVPIVHATGGLVDTVRDELAHPGSGTGFVFEGMTPGDLAAAVHRAMILRATGPEPWSALQRRAMAADFSWDKSAARYAELYVSIL